jgi:5-methylcytosine-specific restriction protein A
MEDMWLYATVAPTKEMLEELLELAKTHGVPRSHEWPKVRAEHLIKEPVCQVCGNKEHLNVHHKKPFHLFPTLELIDTNLITLCEGPAVNCHFFIGHLREWSAYNPDVDVDVAIWREKIAKRLSA